MRDARWICSLRLVLPAVFVLILPWIVGAQPAQNADGNASGSKPPPTAAFDPRNAFQLLPPEKYPGWPLGHTRSINDIAYSPDGNFIASASDDHTVRLWNIKTGAFLKHLLGHTDDVFKVRFSPDIR